MIFGFTPPPTNTAHLPKRVAYPAAAKRGSLPTNLCEDALMSSHILANAPNFEELVFSTKSIKRGTLFGLSVEENRCFAKGSTFATWSIRSRHLSMLTGSSYNSSISDPVGSGPCRPSGAKWRIRPTGGHVLVEPRVGPASSTDAFSRAQPASCRWSRPSRARRCQVAACGMPQSV